MDASTAPGSFFSSGVSPAGLVQSPTAAHEAILRVAFFSDAIPERNGAGSYYTDLVGQLRQRVAVAEIFQPRRKHRPFSGLSVAMPGDPTQRLYTPNLRRVSQRFAALRPQLVVAVTPGPFGLLGLALARHYRCGFVSAFHTQFEALSEMYWNPLARGIATAYLNGLNRLLFSCSSTVMVHSAALCSEVSALGARHTQVMGTPLPGCFLEDAPPERDGSLKRLLFAGRLAPEKNLPAILEAARELPDLEFVIAGDGPLRKEVARAARELPNLRMTGWLDREALRDELDAADLLLLPSRIETFGSIALEAMSRGCPALVSRCAGIFQWPELREGLEPLRQGERLSTAITRLQAQCPQQRRQRAQRARLAAETLNEATLTQWTDLIDRHGR